MSDYYRLSYPGLVYAISSSLSEQKRLLMLTALANSGFEQFTFEEISLSLKMDQAEITTQIESMFELGFISRESDSQAVVDEIIHRPEEFVAKLETLSVNGKVILADENGLVLESCGYSRSDSEYIAAIATNLVMISEQAKARIKNQTEKQLWTTGLSWGGFRALCMSVYIGHKQYILVVGGLPDLETKEFFDIVSFLVRRYGHG